MADIGQLWVSVKLDESSLKNATQKIQSSLTDTGNKIEKTLNKSLLWWIQAFAGNQIASGLTKVAWWALTLAGNLEQADVAFTTMLWSAEASKKMLKDLSDFASKTPFELTGIRQTAKQLLAYGIEADKILPTLKSLWDVSAWLSVPIEQVAYAYGQVRSAWRLLGQDLRQFTNAWVPIISELAKNLWVAESGIKDMVSAGKIWFSDVEKAFQTMSWEWWKFNNLMDKQSKTLLGSWSNFKDAMNTLWEVLGWLFTDSLTWVVTAITWIVNSIKDWAKEHPVLAKSIATIVFVFWSLLAVIWMVAWAIAILAPLFIWTAGIITAVAWWVALLTWWLMLLNWRTETAAESIDRLTKESKKLKDAQDDLNKKFNEWKISQERYTKETEKLQEKQKRTNDLIKAASWASYDYKKAMEDLAKLKLPTNDAKYIAEKKAIIGETQALYDQIIALVKLQEAQNMFSPQTAIKKATWFTIWLDFIQPIKNKANEVSTDLQKMKADFEWYMKSLTTPVKTPYSWPGGGWMSESAKQLLEDQATVYKESFKKIEDEFKASSDRVDDYKKKVKEIGDEFTDMANKAKDELWNVNQSLSQLSTDYANTQWSRYAEVVAQLATAESWSAEWSKLEQERQYLLWITTQAIRDQAVEYYNLSEAQKTTKKYEEDKLALLEKQAIVTAISQQTTWLDAKGNTVLDQNLRVTEANQFEYEAEKWKRVAITDAKNIEYARDQLNKQMKMAQDLLDNQALLDGEYAQQEELNTKKMTLEADFTKFVNEQSAVQRKAIQAIITDVQSAISAINTMNALNAKAKTSSSKWFMAGWYTWDWGLGQEAGVVHAREYVLSNAMLTRLPGIIPALESVRSGWNFDYSRNINVPTINVHGWSFDIVEAFEKLKFRL